eukprot:scaffold115473_cov49-Phaeocystis_antarctica.AAC.1
MVQLKGIDKALPGLAAQVDPNPNPNPDPDPDPNPNPNPNPNPDPNPHPNLTLTTLRRRTSSRCVPRVPCRTTRW